MKRRTGIRRVGGAVVALLAVVGVVWYILGPSEPDLLRQAHLIVEARGGVWTGNWGWSPDGEPFTIQQKRGGDYVVTKGVRYAPLPHGSIPASLVDSSTRRIWSPKGDALLWEMKDYHECVLTDFVHGRTVRWESVKGSIQSFDWLPDGKRCVLFEMDGPQAYLVLRDLETSKSSVVTPLPDTASLMGAAEDGALITRVWSREKSSTVQLTYWRPGLKGVSSVTRTIHLPLKQWWKADVSSDGTHILWNTTFMPPSRVPGWLPKRVASLFPPPRTQCTLWVSKIDGTEMRPIGTSPLLERAVGTTSFKEVSASPTHFQWMPDSRRIAFFYDKGIWVVPVDGPGR